MQIKTNNITYIYSRKTHNEFKALDGVTSVINQGDFIGVIGETGSGKTTYIQHLNALLLPYKGEVIIGERKITNSKRKIKKIKEIRGKVGVVFQFAEYQLFEETIEKDIMFGPINMGVSKENAKELAKKYIKVVGMEEEFLSRSPFNLSGGQKRRVAIAGILAMEPEILIFDEPTAGLDPVGCKEMLALFEDLNKLGKTVVIVTHDLDHVLEVTKNTMLFKEGKLVKFDETYNVLKDTQFLKDNNMQPPKLLEFINKLEAKGKKIPSVKNIEELATFLTGGSNE